MAYVGEVNWHELAAQTASAWQSPGTYKGLLVDIDLTTPQGRWELLVLTMLLAARVGEVVAEKTFMSLQAAGLLLPERLAAATTADRQEVWDILSAEYRAPIKKKKKEEALYSNASRLMSMYNGDMQNIYEDGSFSDPAHMAEASGAVLAKLRAFDQIDMRAKWYCRCMGEAGLWLGLSAEVQLFIDAYVRLVLRRLGLSQACNEWPKARQEMVAVIERFFAGDAASLYKLGRFGCLTADAEFCRSYCQLEPYCLFRRKSGGGACVGEQ